VTHFYNEKPESQPEFLTNTDYYFVKQEEKTITEDILENISDSEIQKKQTHEELEIKQHEKTEKSLSTMVSQITAMNTVLDQVHE